MLTAEELAVMTSDVLLLHTRFPKEPKKAFRFDGVTPFGVHPVLLAMLILNEEHLTEEVRVRGAKALLAHDLLEDTTVELPEWARDPEVEKLVCGLTFTKGQDKYVDVWSRGEDVILLSFFDSVINLTCVGNVLPERMAYKKQKVREHLVYIEQRYPKLEIVKMAKAFLQ